MCVVCVVSHTCVSVMCPCMSVIAMRLIDECDVAMAMSLRIFKDLVSSMT